MSSYTNFNNTNLNIRIADVEQLAGYKWAIAKFLSASYTYNIIESTKSYANQGWDYLLDFTKLIVENQYIEKTSGLSFVVDRAVEKLHQFGDQNINSTIDYIIAKIDDFIDPNVNHYISHQDQAGKVMIYVD